MTFNELAAIADGAATIPAEKVNVRMVCAVCHASDEPLIRRLTRVVRETTRNGEVWLYWYWVPEQTGDIKGVDCGYSGRLERLA